MREINKSDKKLQERRILKKKQGSWVCEKCRLNIMLAFIVASVWK